MVGHLRERGVAALHGRVFFLYRLGVALLYVLADLRQGPPHLTLPSALLLGGYQTVCVHIGHRRPVPAFAGRCHIRFLGEYPVEVQAGAGDVVDQLPPLVGPQGEYVVGPYVGVVPPAPGEAYVDLVLGETQVAEQIVVAEGDHLLPDLHHHLRIRHLVRPGKMVRIEVEDEFRTHPLLVLHHRLGGIAIVGCRIIAMCWHFACHEDLEVVLAGERHMPLHRLPEGDEPELLAGEPVRHLRSERAVVPSEHLEKETVVGIQQRISRGLALRRFHTVCHARGL